MTDVFFCSVPSPRGSLRYGMKEVCWRRWKGEPEIGLRLLAPKTCSEREFQRIRRMLADSQSASDIYVCADDDCLPCARPFLREAIAVLEKHPDFAILSLWPSNCTINRWTPENYSPFEDEEVMEHHSVGGIRVCRKGVLKQWPKMVQFRAYDREHCAAIRAARKRVGYFKNLKMNHIGEGWSTVWP